MLRRKGKQSSGAYTANGGTKSALPSLAARNAMRKEKLDKYGNPKFSCTHIFVGCAVLLLGFVAIIVLSPQSASKLEQLGEEELKIARMLESLAEEEVLKAEKFAEEETKSLRKRFVPGILEAEKSFLHSLLGDNSKNEPISENIVAGGEKIKRKGKEITSVDSSNSQNDAVKYYMVFSTGCSAFQDWQSYTFFYHAMKVKQPGEIIRIVSGCTDAETAALKKVHEEKIKIMSDKFHLHVTPDFAGPKKYKYYNKPFGLRHFLEHYLGYPNLKEADDAIVMILDPDQILLRPLTHDFTNTNAIYVRDEGEAPKTKVVHGTPFATNYMFGAQPFEKINTTIIAGRSSLIQKVSKKDQVNHYPAGPPYIATVRDMYRIVVTWTDFVPMVHHQYPYLLAEMFAYCLAAAHWGKAHQLVPSLMISDVHALDRGAEGWQLLDKYSNERMCEPFDQKDLPFVLHYCQSYWLGKWFIGKYRLHKDFYSCEAPLLKEPPKDIGEKYDYYIKPGESKKLYGKREPIKWPNHRKRAAFMICYLIPALNEVAIWYKHHHCEKSTANYNKTYVFHKNMDPNINNYTNYGPDEFPPA